MASEIPSEPWPDYEFEYEDSIHRSIQRSASQGLSKSSLNLARISPEVKSTRRKCDDQEDQEDQDHAEEEKFLGKQRESGWPFYRWVEPGDGGTEVKVSDSHVRKRITGDPNGSSLKDQSNPQKPSPDSSSFIGRFARNFTDLSVKVLGFFVPYFKVVIELEVEDLKKSQTTSETEASLVKDGVKASEQGQEVSL